ncbi:unnamed protein product [Acanthosepion pharaonis]|uniref:Uncharacterized protein n=1 Tax=Acanthosepion pharaonis TaxID=158019 RepID=A0A812BVL3_ACAPH|nr:unnamed protein product [Sepia pharaonis]
MCVHLVFHISFTVTRLVFNISFTMCVHLVFNIPFNVCPSRLHISFLSTVLSSIFFLRYVPSCLQYSPSMCVHLVFHISFLSTVLSSIFPSMCPLVFNIPFNVCPSRLPYFFHCLPVLSSNISFVLLSHLVFNIPFNVSISSSIFLSLSTVLSSNGFLRCVSSCLVFPSMCVHLVFHISFTHCLPVFPSSIFPSMCVSILSSIFPSMSISSISFTVYRLVFNISLCVHLVFNIPFNVCPSRLHISFTVYPSCLQYFLRCVSILSSIFPSMCPSRLPYFFHCLHLVFNVPSMCVHLVFNIPSMCVISSSIFAHCLPVLSLMFPFDVSILSSIFPSMCVISSSHISFCLPVFIFNISFDVCPSCLHIPFNVCPSRLPYFFHCLPVLSSLFLWMCVHLVFNIPSMCPSCLPIFLSLSTRLVFNISFDVSILSSIFPSMCVHLVFHISFTVYPSCLQYFLLRCVSILSSIFLQWHVISSSIFLSLSTRLVFNIFLRCVSILTSIFPSMCVHLVFHISFTVYPSCLQYFLLMCVHLVFNIPFNVCPSRLPYFFHCLPVLSSIFPSMCPS